MASAKGRNRSHAGDNLEPTGRPRDRHETENLHREVTMNVIRFSQIAFVFAFAFGGCTPKTEVPEGAQTTQIEKPESPGLKVQEGLISEGLKYVGYPFNKKITYEANGLTTTGEKLTEILIPSYES